MSMTVTEAITTTVTLGETVKDLRLKLGLSREELADRAGTSYSYIANIETGLRTPHLAMLIDIASGLGLRASTLLSLANL